MQENLHITQIAPSKGRLPLNLKELWKYKDLIYYFVWRDIKVRYKQTIMGASWAIIQPLFTMVIFSIFFGRLADMPSDGVPYPIFSYAALVPWTYFSNSVIQSANSLIMNADMVKKIYFPRLAMPIASVFAGLLDFTLAFIVLLGMLLIYGYVPTKNIILLPLFLLLAVITALGVGFWFSAMNTQFRDVRYVVPFLIQAWMFITPIAYPSSLLSEPWLTLYGINPMAGVVEGFRWALLGTETAPEPMIFVSFIVATLILLSGLLYFRKMEISFADII